MKNIDENYAEKLVNAVAKTIVEVFENLTIEDANMYQIGYNKAIDEFVEYIEWEATNHWVFDLEDEEEHENFLDEIRIMAEQMKGE